MIKAVIFDYGGVVIKILPDLEYEQIFADAFGVSLAEFQKILPPFFRQLDLGLPEKKFWPLISEAFKKPVPKNADKIFVEPFLKALVFYSEIFDLVRKLKQKGIKTAVLSTNMETQERLIRERHGYDDFDVVVLSNSVGLRKPDPEIYKLTVQKLKVKYTECLFIDDNEVNLFPAEKLGMKTILAKNPRQVVKDILKVLPQV